MGSAFDQVVEVAGYRLAERIGSGGMGEVYKAYNSSLNRFAAVKILFQAAMSDRFKNEAYIQSSITHPNIARLYEFTRYGEKQCIIMEYVEGESLDAVLRRKRKFSIEETEEILRQVVSALVYLHKKDIIHRDIKPQNFKIQADGTVKMLDFGIAKHKYSPKFTQSGFIVGTSEYLSPEQFQQEPELKSDIWALAVMTYEFITGYLPFEAPNAITLQTKIRKGDFTDPKLLAPSISDKLSVIIDKSLKVNPQNRISAAGIAIILGDGDGRFNLFHRPLPDIKKKSLLAGIAAVALLFILFLLINNNSSDVKPGIDNTNNTVIDQAVAEQTGVKSANEQEVTNIAKPGGSGSKIIINTPGISNAELILSDGSHQPLPYTANGKEGDKFEFTIHAEGYKDKEVQVVLTPRRISYEFNLEKNNK